MASPQNALTPQPMTPRVMEVDVDGGLDSKTDPNRAAIPKTTIAQDVIYTTPGQVRKRPSFGALSAIINGNTLAAGYNIGTYKTNGSNTVQTLVHGATGTQPYPGPPGIFVASNASSTSNSGIVTNTGPYPYIPSVFSANLLPGISTQASWACMTIDQRWIVYVVMAPYGSGNNYITVYAVDPTTGIVVNSMPTSLFTTWGNLVGISSCIKLVPTGDNGVMVITSNLNTSTYQIGTNKITISTTGTISIGTYVALVATTTASVTPASGGTYASPIDAVYSPTYGILLAYTDSSNNAHVVGVNNAGTATTGISGSVAMNSGSKPFGVSLATAGNYVSALFIDSTSLGSQTGYGYLYYAGSSWTSAATTANLFYSSTNYVGNCAAVGQLTSTGYTGTHLMTAYGNTYSHGIAVWQATYAPSTWTSTSPNTPLKVPVSGATGDTVPACVIAATPAIVNNQLLVPILLTGDSANGIAQHIIMALNSTNWRVVTYLTTSGSQAAINSSNNFISSSFVYNNALYFAYQLSAAINLTSVAKISEPTVLPPMQQIENITYIPGGILQAYGGNGKSVDAYFGNQPPAPRTYLANTGGSYLPAGTYYYCYVWRMYDSAGNVYLSNPSPIASVTAPGSTQNPFIEAFLPLVPASYSVVIDFYRSTLANAGQTLYYVYSQNQGLQSGTLDTAYAGGSGWSSWNAELIFNDSGTNSDTSIALNPQLYNTNFGATTGSGNHPNSTPPAFSYFTQGLSRLWGVSATSPNRIYFSDAAPQFPVGNALNWYVYNYIEIPTTDGGVTAIAIMGTNVLVFTKNQIWGFTGTGPTPSSAATNPVSNAATFSVPQLIASDVGCSAPGTVCLVPAGLMFQSRKGFIMLDQSLNVHYLPDPDSFAQTYTYGRNLILPEYQTVIFTAPTAAQVTTPAALAYNYEQNKWSVLTGFNGVALADGAPGSWYQLKSSGQLGLFFQTSQFEDYGTTYYPLTIETPWIKLGSITGWGDIMEMQVLGQYQSPHTLQIQVAYDYGPYQSTLTTNTNTALVNGDTVYQFRYHMPRRNRCYAIRFKIQDTAQAGTGESCRISGLVLHLASDGGLSRLPAIKSG